MKALLAIVGALMLAACGDDGSSDPRQAGRSAAIEARDNALREQAVAEERAALAEAEARKLKQQVDDLVGEVAKLDAQSREAEIQLGAATTAAERDLIARRLGAIHTKQRELIAQLDKVKASVKLRCPPDQPLC